MQPTLPMVDAEGREIVPWGTVPPFKTQLLKWIGNKQRFAHEIVSYFPRQFGTYYEPFLGSGAVLATLAEVGIWFRRFQAADRHLAGFEEAP